MVYRALDPDVDASLYLADTEPIGEPRAVIPRCDWCDEEFDENDYAYEVDSCVYCERCLFQLYAIPVRQLIKYE